ASMPLSRPQNNTLPSGKTLRWTGTSGRCMTGPNSPSVARDKVWLTEESACTLTALVPVEVREVVVTPIPDPSDTGIGLAFAVIKPLRDCAESPLALLCSGIVTA